MKPKIKKLFIDFLKKEEVIERYKINWLCDEYYSNSKPIKKPEHLINHAFLWEDTPELHKFWFDLNIKWRNVLGYENHISNKNN